MIDGDTIKSIAIDFLPTNAAAGANFLASAKLRPEANIIALEDLFYCTHNAARSAQTGNDGTVPPGFHPVNSGGVVHERRHALTWLLSDGVSWDETDVST